MRTLETRILAIEAQRAVREELAPDLNKAVRSIADALGKALPIVDALNAHRSEYGKYSALGANRNATTFEDHIRELHNRIMTGTMTDDDDRVLASLPVADLTTMGMTAAEMIELYVRAYNQF